MMTNRCKASIDWPSLKRGVGCRNGTAPVIFLNLAATSDLITKLEMLSSFVYHEASQVEETTADETDNWKAAPRDNGFCRPPTVPLFKMADPRIRPQPK